MEKVEMGRNERLRDKRFENGISQWDEDKKKVIGG